MLARSVRKIKSLKKEKKKKDENVNEIRLKRDQLF